MKQINTLVAGLALFAFIFTSCSGNIDLTKEEDSKKISEAINKDLKEDAKATSVMLSILSNGFSTECDMIIVYYKTPEDENRQLTLFPSGKAENSDEESKFKVSEVRIPGRAEPAKKGRAIKDYDFSVVSKNIAKAAEQVIAKGHEYSGLGTYTITYFEDATLDKHTFSILSKVENSTKIQGRSIVTEYYEFDCKADAAGNVTVNLDE